MMLIEIEIERSRKISKKKNGWREVGRREWGFKSSEIRGMRRWIKR